MNTTLTVKTDAKLRDEAKEAAEQLGVPLTTVVNALLKQFVRDRTLSLSVEPSPTKAKIKLWEMISAEMEKEKGARKFGTARELLAHLKLS